MADALDAVLQLRKERQVRDAATADAISGGFQNLTNSFIQGQKLQQQAFENQIAQQSVFAKLQNAQTKAQNSQLQQELLNQALTGAASKTNFALDSIGPSGPTFKNVGLEAQKKGRANESEVNNFVSGMVNIVRSAERAAPGGVSPTDARIRGVQSKLSQFTGIGVDPQVSGELDTLKLKARSTLKEFESGRLTDKDVVDAVNVITGVNRNTPERVARALNVSRQIAADRGIDPDIMEKKIADGLGISTEDLNKIANGDISAKEASTLLLSGSKKEALPDGVTEDDIKFTMKKHGMTRKQVLEALSA